MRLIIGSLLPTPIKDEGPSLFEIGIRTLVSNYVTSYQRKTLELGIYVLYNTYTHAVMRITFGT